MVISIQRLEMKPGANPNRTAIFTPGTPRCPILGIQIGGAQAIQAGPAPVILIGMTQAISAGLAPVILIGMTQAIQAGPIRAITVTSIPGTQETGDKEVAN